MEITRNQKTNDTLLICLYMTGIQWLQILLLKVFFIIIMVYRKNEKVEIIFIFASHNECARVTARLFNEKYPERNVSHKYVLEIVKKFRETGSVANIKRIRDRPALNEANQIGILGQIAVDPTLSTRQLNILTQISRTSIQKMLKMHKFHPYKLQLHQELNEDDYDRRSEFCENMTRIIERNPDILKHICFSDECSFYLNGFVNRQNCRYWSDNNPHIFIEEHTQRPQKINLWAGILGNKIIGPLVIDGHLNANIYLQMLENKIKPLMTTAINEDPNLVPENVYFQQDGAPPHYGLPVREWLNQNFPGQWLGRRGPIEWPARSPDLAPNDFFLWGHLKSIIYKTPPVNLQDLENRIYRECQAIPCETFRRVQEGFRDRLYHCLGLNGAHFEHLL